MAYGPNVYASEDISVSFGGESLLGLAPDSGVGISRNENITDEEVGMDSQDPVISIHPNKSGIVTLTFQQESDGHRKLSDLIQRQQTGKIFVQQSLLVRVNSGERIYLPKAHVKTAPDLTWGSTATGSNRAYQFFGNIINYATEADFLAGISSTFSF